MIYHPSLALLFSLVLFLVHPSRSLAHQSSRHIKQKRAPLRDVSVIIDIFEDRATTPEGKSVFPVHSALWIAGNELDGPLKIEIGIDDEASDFDQNLHLRVLDETTAKSGKTYQPGAMRKVTTETRTRLTNQQFMDSLSGKGLAANAWARDTLYRTGRINKGNLNTCNNFIQRLVEQEMGQTLSTQAKRYFDLAKIWTEDFNAAGVTQDVTKMRYDTKENGVKLRKDFNVWQACSKAKNKRAGACSAIVAPKDDKPPTQVDNFNEKNELALGPIASKASPDQLKLPEDEGLSSKTLPPNTISTDKGSKVSFARAGGSLETFTAVGKDALQALGIAGSVVGAVFVILDYVDHNWVGGAIGAVGLAAGVAAGIVLSDPLGWVVGGAIVALFASKCPSSSVLLFVNGITWCCEATAQAENSINLNCE